MDTCDVRVVPTEVSKLYDVEEVEKVRVPDKGWLRKFMAFAGPGLLVSIAYLDPGNIETDIKAGALHKYQLLWVMVFSTILGFVLQILAARLGIVTKYDLAIACRKCYPRSVSFMLWIATEISVVCADICEVIGTAVALKLLFGLELWIGVLFTSLDTFALLALQYFNVRFIELLITLLVGIMAICFVAEVVFVQPPLLEVLEGFIPSTLDASGLFVAIALLGAVVMPHNLFLHSSLVKSRLIEQTVSKKREAILFNTIESALALTVSCFVNICIIILSGVQIYPNDAGLVEAYQLLKNMLYGKWGSILFAVALLASGQSSILTGTYAGQFIMEGFLNLKIALWKRNAITRSVAIIPSLIIVIAVSGGGDALITVSSCILSFELPFALFPLIKITSSRSHMGDEFVNNIWYSSISWFLGFLVVIANMFLVGYQIMDYLDFSKGHFWISVTLLLLSGIFVIVYIVLICLLIYLPVDIPIEDEDISAIPVEYACSFEPIPVLQEAEGLVSSF